jgi:dUTP pyrophosphatase
MYSFDNPKEQDFRFSPQALAAAGAPVPIKVKRDPNCPALPEYKTASAACMDICAAETQTIPPHTTKAIETGLYFEIPPGFVMYFHPRSGLALNHNLTLANAVGVLDSDYRGPAKVLLHNLGDKYETVHRGDRIAQISIAQIPRIVLQEVDELSETERGAGGFGSTGVK